MLFIERLKYHKGTGGWGGRADKWVKPQKRRKRKGRRLGCILVGSSSWDRRSMCRQFIVSVYLSVRQGMYGPTGRRRSVLFVHRVRGVSGNSQQGLPGEKCEGRSPMFYSRKWAMWAWVWRRPLPGPWGGATHRKYDISNLHYVCIEVFSLSGSTVSTIKANVRDWPRLQETNGRTRTVHSLNTSCDRKNYILMLKKSCVK